MYLLFILYRNTEKRVHVQCWLFFPSSETKQTEHLWYKSVPFKFWRESCFGLLRLSNIILEDIRIAYIRILFLCAENLRVCPNSKTAAMETCMHSR